MSIKKEVKKVATTKKVKSDLPKQSKYPVKLAQKKEPTIELVSFSVRATIPVMVFGNISPEIIVKAGNIEDAKSYALPIIENLFEKYCESPRDGSPKPSFVSKANVVATEKVVPQNTPKADPVVVEPGQFPVSAINQGAIAPAKTSDGDNSYDNEPTYATSAAYARALKAIEAAQSLDAINTIWNQVNDSVKLTPEEKPMLRTIILEKKSKFN